MICFFWKSNRAYAKNQIDAYAENQIDTYAEIEHLFANLTRID